MTADRERLAEIADEILTKRGPDRVMEVQRARMWERNPSEWTRYERLLAEGFAALAAERDEALRERDEARIALTKLAARWQRECDAAVARAERAEEALESVKGNLYLYRIEHLTPDTLIDYIERDLAALVSPPADRVAAPDGQDAA